ncbi:MAG: PAS domain-containing protein [Synechococcales cyanobacterium T60_A2020_003]|nr:PAS domain-containing protein [Synechococcales cyanobacterium T60_A2020_003]
MRQQTQQLRADIQQQQQDAELILQQADPLNITTDAIIVQDLDWNIRFWNKGAERMYGWRAEEACHPEVSLLMSPSPSPDLDMAKQIALEKGAWQGELKKWTKSGQELTVSIRWDLVRDKDGHPQSILCVETDITELKGIEQSLQTSQTLYESLVNSLPVNLYRIDLEGRVTFVNQVLQQSLGVPEDAVIGKTSGVADSRYELMAAMTGISFSF